MLRNLVVISIVILVASFILGFNWKNGAEDEFRVMFYNVENLFDTINDPNKDDDEFTPESEKHWNTKRYWTKHDHLLKVIKAVCQFSELPAVIGLSEVENRKVLEDMVDLIYHDSYGNLKYTIVHYESPDTRGIDCALLYDPRRIQGIESRVYHVDISDLDSGNTTRDILYFKGVVDRQEIVFLVNHWPSRWGGVEASEPKRLEAARVTRSIVDSLIQSNPNHRIMIMGDFNDNPSNKSVKHVLVNGSELDDPNPDLVNLMEQFEGLNKGTYRYRGRWDILDQIIVSNDFMFQQKVFIKPGSAGIYIAPWMLYEDKKYGLTPSRTYGGPNYYGGYSDHLPVYVDVRIK